jgi:hypothetical protein
MRPIAAILALATSAHAQSVTFSVVLSTADPVSPGAVINATVRCTWQDPQGIGFAGGAFRFRIDDTAGPFAMANVVAPNNNSGGVNSESTGDRVGVPASELFPGEGTVPDRWTLGRRPKRAFLQDATDPTSLSIGGGFRFPPLGTGPTDLHYSVEQQTGVTYLTGRNGAGAENRIEFANLPPVLAEDPRWFERATAFDLFKFQVRAPLSGSGTVTITPEILLASIFISDAGAQHVLSPDQIHTTPASFTYIPAAGPAALLPLAIAFALRRSTRRRP